MNDGISCAIIHLHSIKNSKARRGSRLRSLLNTYKLNFKYLECADMLRKKLWGPIKPEKGDNNLNILLANFIEALHQAKLIGSCANYADPADIQTLSDKGKYLSAKQDLLKEIICISTRKPNEQRHIKTLKAFTIENSKEGQSLESFWKEDNLESYEQFKSTK